MASVSLLARQAQDRGVGRELSSFRALAAAVTDFRLGLHSVAKSPVYHPAALDEYKSALAWYALAWYLEGSGIAAAKFVEEIEHTAERL